jgi:hypothetical protein
MGNLPLRRVIIKLLRNGVDPNVVAKRLNVTTDRIRYEVEEWQKTCIRRARGRPLCTCCGEFPVMRTNKFLCKRCFRRPPVDGSCNPIGVSMLRSLGGMELSYNTLNEYYY